MKKMKAVMSIVLAVLMTATIISGCSSQSQNTSDQSSSQPAAQSSAKPADKKPVVAYITAATDDPFWNNLATGIKQNASKYGVDVLEYDSRLDAATQLKNAQNAITKNVDVIIISPTDSASCASVLEEAKKANVPVVIADIGTDKGEYASFVISSNKKGSREVGDYLAEYFKKNNISGGPVAQITISLTRINGQNRLNGFKEAMESAGIELGDLRQSEKYTRAESEGFAQNLMTAAPDLKAIFCHYNEGTLGVVKAVENAKKEKDVAVVGFDGSPEMVEALKAGKVLATAMQQPVLMGRYAMDAANDIINGKTPEKEIEVPTLLVTKDNVNEMADKLADTVFPK
ncbi:substrate-binding domain-containing protein [Petroclostridium sp. X23]|uniref:substrate-binding domain-containing protein n=1 Tax=Petroclostridium sp. X23 TaxID=3045146 RepID=UPI0024AE6359|nr:substrate-binding domain-containing protein [Petroclostridium sp. X23]WHH57972.1 substrate-binding domain-containing protein [Petroclostridium sp. X23]